MLYGFELYLANGGTTRGVVSAENMVAAYAAVCVESCDPVVGFELFDLEELVATQYRGMAFLTTERF